MKIDDIASILQISNPTYSQQLRSGCCKSLSIDISNGQPTAYHCTFNKVEVYNGDVLVKAIETDDYTVDVPLQHVMSFLMPEFTKQSKAAQEQAEAAAKPADSVVEQLVQPEQPAPSAEISPANL